MKSYNVLEVDEKHFVSDVLAAANGLNVSNTDIE